MFKGASGFHAGESGGAPPVGTGGIYGGDGSVPNGTIATIGDTLTFAGGNVVMGASANLLVGLNELQFVGDKIFNDSGALVIEGNTAGIVLVSDTGEELELSSGIGLTLTGSASSFWLNTTTTDNIFQFSHANGTLFDGNLGSLALTVDRTWRLPDETGTIALTTGTFASGIYGGTGTIPSSVVATVTDEFTFSGGVVAVNSTLSMGAGDEIQFSASGVITLIDTLEIKIGRVGIGGPPDASSILQLTSTSQGFLPPRMTTTQRDAISSPAKGLIVYNRITDQWEGNSGTSGSPVWVILG